MTMQERLDEIRKRAYLILYAVAGLDGPLAKPIGDDAERIIQLLDCE